MSQHLYLRNSVGLLDDKIAGVYVQTLVQHHRQNNPIVHVFLWILREAIAAKDQEKNEKGKNKVSKRVRNRWQMVME